MFTVVIMGQPITGNHANRIVKGYRRLRDGSTGSYPKLAKTEEARAYQQGIAMIARAARPSGWSWPEGRFLRCEWRLYLGHPIDASNVLKCAEDGLFPALGVNDVWHLPNVTLIRHHCPPTEQRIEVDIDCPT